MTFVCLFDLVKNSRPWSSILDQIKQKLDALKTIVNEVTTELYKNATPPPGEGEQSNQAQDNPNEQTTDEQKSDPEKNKESKGESDSEQESKNS